LSEPCEICGSARWTSVYSGKIRNGALGNFIDGKIFRCIGCNVDRLDEEVSIKSEAYQSEEYRKIVNQGLGIDDYFKHSDPIQIHNLNGFWPLDIRGKKIADIGTGGGSFLDSVSGLADEVIAIEPTEMYHSSLKKRGYRVFNYTADAIKEYRNKMDIVFSFQVIEHVLNPKRLLREALELLRPCGKMIIATPNRNDILLKLLPDDFPSLYYRTQHRWYFDKNSIINCFGQIAALGNSELNNVEFIHTFGMSNCLTWLKEKSPKGDLRLEGISPVADKMWSAYLQSTGQTDTLILTATKIGS